MEGCAWKSEQRYNVPGFEVLEQAEGGLEGQRRHGRETIAARGINTWDQKVANGCILSRYREAQKGNSGLYRNGSTKLAGRKTLEPRLQATPEGRAMTEPAAGHLGANRIASVDIFRGLTVLVM